MAKFPLKELFPRDPTGLGLVTSSGGFTVTAELKLFDKTLKTSKKKLAVSRSGKTVSAAVPEVLIGPDGGAFEILYRLAGKPSFYVGAGGQRMPLATFAGELYVRFQLKYPPMDKSNRQVVKPLGPDLILRAATTGFEVKDKLKKPVCSSKGQIHSFRCSGRLELIVTGQVSTSVGVSGGISAGVQGSANVGAQNTQPYRNYGDLAFEARGTAKSFKTRSVADVRRA